MYYNVENNKKGVCLHIDNHVLTGKEVSKIIFAKAVTTLEVLLRFGLTSFDVVTSLYSY